MTFACTDCSTCGKCYEKNSTCAACGGAIYLLDDACPTCGEPITDEMRQTARKAYMDRKAQDKKKIIELAQAAKARRLAAEASRPKVVYPWDQDKS